MQKSITTISISFIMALLLLLTLGTRVFATVGGPTLIEKLAYSSSENALYYLLNDMGGRGCPPEIKKIDLETREETFIMSCDEIMEKYQADEGSFNSGTYNQFIEETFRGLETMLPIISLPNNNVSVKVAYKGEEKFDEYNGSNFSATILQNGQEKAGFDFLGCYKDQPNVFRAYMIPNTEKMVIKVSRIGDCFEGGYTKDDIFVFNDIIDLQDATAVGYSTNYSTLEPGVHRGDIVAWAQESAKPTPKVEEPKNGEAIFSRDLLALWGTLTLIIGFLTGVVGYAMGKKTKTNNQS